jgi:glycosyltransferase involved in cell wall biosynthesis
MKLIISLLLACGIVVVLFTAKREYLRLPQLRSEPGGDTRDVTVIIPARNEAKTIAAAVKSFASRVPVIVVDDGSGDKTGEIAKGAGAEVIAAPPLRKGVAGKANACAAGAKAAATTWLLFVDADTRFADAFLPSLMAEVRKNSLDMVSVYLKEECASVWEAIVLPYAIALSFTGVNARAVNAKKTYDALASGTCMLFRREVYDFMGGHGAVQTSFIEDAMLAYIAKRHRINQRVFRAEHLGTVRRADGLKGVWRWLQRSSFRFMLVSRWCGLRVLLSAIVMTSYVPVVAVLVWMNYHPLAGVVALVPPVLLARWYGGLHRSILSPYAIYAFDIIGVLALIGTALGRGTRWKGRRV